MTRAQPKPSQPRRMASGPVQGYNFTVKMFYPARVVTRWTMKEEDAMRTVTGDRVRLIIFAILIIAALLLWLSGR